MRSHASIAPQLRRLRRRLQTLSMATSLTAVADAVAFPVVLLAPHVIGSPGSPWSGSQPVLAQGVDRGPWYGLRLLHDNITFTPSGLSLPSPPSPNARAGILVDLDTHTVLWRKDDHVPLPPASTTKI